MAARDKIYAIPTPTGRTAENPKVDPGLALQLPAHLELDRPVKLDLPVSDNLPYWNERGRSHEVILRLRLMRATERDRLHFKLNGTELPTQLLRTINHTYQLSAPRFRSHSSYWYIFRLDRDHWPLLGDNALEVILGKRDPEATPLLWVREVELEIRYLRG